MKVTLHPVAILSYLPALVVMYLAASYLGGMFRTLFLFVLLLPLPMQLLAAVPVLLFRVRQQIDNVSPVRGEAVTYTALIHNRAPFPVTALRARLVQSGPETLDRHEERSLAFESGREVCYEQRIDCVHRGIYRVGLDDIGLTDMLGWATYHRTQQPCHFSVYPKVVRTRAAAAVAASAADSAARSDSFSRDADPMLLRGVVEYRRNDPVRHIAWRRFAAHGTPYVKEYDSNRHPTAIVCIDLRRIDAPPQQRLAADDCSVEALVAVVKVLVESRISVDVCGFGEHSYESRLTSQVHFHDFYRSTRMIRFGGERCPRYLPQRHCALRPGRGNSMVFITHRVDETVVKLLQPTRPFAVAGLINTIALSDEEYRTAQRLADKIVAAGGTVSLVSAADRLAEVAGR